MSNVNALPLEGKSWACAACGVLSFGLSVPTERLCLRCRPEPPAEAPVPLEERLAAAGVPARFRRGWSRESWSREFGPWPAHLRLWRAGDDEATLLLAGDPGHGKTGLATILLAEALAAGASGRWVRAQDLVEAHLLSWEAARAGRDTASRYAVDVLELERSCREVDVLVLDDLFGNPNPTPKEAEIVRAVVVARYDLMGRTIVTTNRSRLELLQLLPSLASRLLSGLRVTLEGEQDRRLG